jgi:membrane protein DedA with SNARE-associated domain
MTELVSTYGLSALFLGVVLESAGIPVPGETALIVASVLATRGTFALSSVIAVAAGAAVVGDNIGYWIGLRGGRRLLERWRPLARYADRVLPPAERFFVAHGGKSVFLARFIPVLRVTGAFTAGVARMDWWRFFLWNMAGGVAWAATVALVAYHLGAAAVATMGRLGLVGTATVIAGAAIVSLIVHRARWVKIGELARPRRIWSCREDVPRSLPARTCERPSPPGRSPLSIWGLAVRPTDGDETTGASGGTSARDDAKDHTVSMVR